MGHPQQTATYVRALKPTPPEYLNAAAGTDGHFCAEVLDLKLPGKVYIGDIDGDGLFDAVGSHPADGLAYWRNDGGALTRIEPFIPQLAGRHVGHFAFADYDNDGRKDLFVSRMAKPVESGLVNAFLKKLFWYPFDTPAAEMRLFRQTGDNVWRDVTSDTFPDGPFPLYHKLEPIVWFDANGDGALDAVVSQYPSPHGSRNALFIQTNDGTFRNRMADHVSPLPALSYPEGSDVADIDGDGDVDLFAYGFPFLNDGSGYFHQVCGKDFGGIPCDMETRIEEGATFEDLNGDGVFDLLLSHHGASPGIPKYYLQILEGRPEAPGSFRRVTAEGHKYYGFNAYLRAKDFDANGTPDILTIEAGRLLVHENGTWLDALPGITGKESGTVRPLGWLDIDDDGDWDFLANHLDTGETHLYRNMLNPRRFVRFSARGHNGTDNQAGAVFRFSRAGDKPLLHSFRDSAGFFGTTDPRLVLPVPESGAIAIEGCFTSLKALPGGMVERDGIRITASPTGGTCVRYTVDVSPAVERADVILLADRDGASVRHVNGTPRP